MMTGQLLGGAPPLVAAEYQMAIIWLEALLRALIDEMMFSTIEQAHLHNCGSFNVCGSESCGSARSVRQAASPHSLQDHQASQGEDQRGSRAVEGHRGRLSSCRILPSHGVLLHVASKRWDALLRNSGHRW